MALLTQVAGSDAQKLLMLAVMLGVLVLGVGMIAVWRWWYCRSTSQ